MAVRCGGYRRCSGALWSRRIPPGRTAVFEVRLCGRRAATSASHTAASGRDYEGLWSNRTFDELGVHPLLIRALEDQGIVRPTVVQAEAFRPLARGRDTVLRAETGSGKTLAYLLPLVNRIYHLHDRAKQAAAEGAANPLQSSRPWVILAPTSDLCAQILAMLAAVDAERLVSAQSLRRLFRWEALGATGARAGEPQEGGFRAPTARETTTSPEEPLVLRAPRGNHDRPGADVAVSPQIRWGAVDLVVCTPIHFCEDLASSREDGMYPACIVMDEADMLFHGITRSSATYRVIA
eukprot:TRINITY_DN21179_c0_g1_i2.p1 TRINITY_DN21179_c0_g1~~TRINITY_DN21179_c0_g1_i2.p1  ORF type:complete len:294 (+),score=38.71 TRINITY_DN21179_c0_g1_i2:49-930(+)